MVDNTDPNNGDVGRVSDNNEAASIDSALTSGTDTTTNLTTTAVELKVGASRLPERKYLIVEGLSNNIKWGFTTSCPFDLFKNQLIMMPIGVAVYAKMSTGTGSIAVGEAN